MRTKTLILPKQKEKVFSRFGVDFLIKDNQVFLITKHNGMEYRVLVENDADFFFKMSETWEDSNLSSIQWPFIPKKSDWETIKKDYHSLLINITPRCNSNCKVCWNKEWLPFVDMTIEQIKDIISKIGRDKRVLMFGGEPTVREDMFEIIDLIRESGNIPMVYTNGLKLADPDYVKKLREHGIYRVVFSFDGFREDIYEKLRGDKNQLYIKLKALKNLEKFGIQVILSSTITAGINDDEIGRILNFSIKNVHFIKGIYYFCTIPYMGRFDVSPRKMLMPSDILKSLERITNGVISREYVIEFKKLAVNLYYLLKKFGIYFPPGHYHAMSLFRAGSIKQFIPLKELKKMNKEIKKNKFLFILRSLFSRRSLLFLKLLINKNKIESLGKNVFNVNATYINTPFNYIPVKFDTCIVWRIKNPPVNLIAGDPS
jgi:uncharacterized radical SAM superfamily Fe-S cluster-containing enzyme